MIEALKSLLAHPLTRGIDINDPDTTSRRREIIRQKKFLYKIYDEWYGIIQKALPALTGPVVELGSGAGFLRERIPNIIRSEIFPNENLDVVLDGRDLPFPDASLTAIVMTDVMHHIPDADRFLSEVERCLRPAGRMIMIEPWVTWWGSIVYRNFHHEPFEPEANTWSFPSSGPLSGANGALPWIVFERDRGRFEQQYPSLRIDRINPLMPLCYLLSGGVSLRSLLPGAVYGLVRAIEGCLRPLAARLGMFAVIVVTKIESGPIHSQK